MDGLVSVSAQAVACLRQWVGCHRIVEVVRHCRKYACLVCVRATRFREIILRGAYDLRSHIDDPRQPDAAKWVPSVKPSLRRKLLRPVSQERHQLISFTSLIPCSVAHTVLESTGRFPRDLSAINEPHTSKKYSPLHLHIFRALRCYNKDGEQAALNKILSTEGTKWSFSV